MKKYECIQLYKFVAKPNRYHMSILFLETMSKHYFFKFDFLKSNWDNAIQY